MKRVRVQLIGKLWGFIPIQWTVTSPIPVSENPVYLPVAAGPLKGEITVKLVD